MPELGEHKSPVGKGAPTEGLRSGFLEAQCSCCPGHTVRRRDSHHSQSALGCSGEPAKSQTKLTIQCLIKTQLPTHYPKDSKGPLQIPLLTESLISLSKDFHFFNILTFEVIE